MHDLLLLAAFVLATGVGWWLGRRDANKSPVQSPALAEEYFKGLSFLLDEQPDEAIDHFLQALDINSETVDTHLALGRLFRKRGDVEKATRIHRALLARPDLEKSQLLLAQYELANDYMAAGLLDRAERILLELGNAQGEIKWRSLQLLMELYQNEKEWDRSITVAQQLLGRKHPSTRPLLAHFCCEKAQVFICSGGIEAARKELKRALGYDGSCVRASLLKGSLELGAGNYRKAIKAYKKVRYQDASFLTEIITGLAHCYHKLGREKELGQFLRDCLQDNASVGLALAAADYLYFGDNKLEDTNRFIGDALQASPSLNSVAYLLDAQKQKPGPVKKEMLDNLQAIVGQLIELQPVYRCNHCGYSGKKLVWLCPGCRKWGTIKPINEQLSHEQQV